MRKEMRAKAQGHTRPDENPGIRQLTRIRARIYHNSRCFDSHARAEMLNAAINYGLAVP